MVEEELVVGGSGESQKKLKAGIQEERTCVCVSVCVCVAVHGSFRVGV